jgi:hypothetical protein
MIIPLNNIPKDKSQSFVDHLNSTLRSKFSAYQGSSQKNLDGTFESFITGTINFSTPVPVRITLRRAYDESLEFIEVIEENETPNEAIWEKDFLNLIIFVMSAALSNKTQRFSQRHLFYYDGPALDGEYWFSGIRFAPLLPNDEIQEATFIERITCIDMQIDAFDEMHAFAIAQQRANQFSARLSLLLNYGLYRSPVLHCWFLPSTNTEPFQSIRGQRGYFGSEASIISFPRKWELCQPGKYEGKLNSRIGGGHLLSLPRESRRIMRTIDEGLIEIKTRFDSAARLFQVALLMDHHFPSVGLAYRVAALDALSGGNGKKNLRDFISNHLPEPIDNKSFNHMWRTVRSAHFHGGEFPNGEFDISYNMGPLMDPARAERWPFNSYYYQLISEVISKWIFDLLDSAVVNEED